MVNSFKNRYNYFIIIPYTVIILKLIIKALYEKNQFNNLKRLDLNRLPDLITHSEFKLT